MPYTDHYERDIYGIIAFWIRDHLEHGSFFDREISHHELEIARENQDAMGRLNSILVKADCKSVDVGNLLDVSRHETRQWRDLLVHTMDKHMRCELIISTPHLLMEHMIREADESLRVYDLIQSGGRVSPADASVHENHFWLRVMAEHLGFIRHYSDPFNFKLNRRIDSMTQTFYDLYLQADVFRGSVKKPRTMYPALSHFNQETIARAKDLEKFKLELDALIKECSVLTTSPPDLLEHIAREAHHFYRNLEDLTIA